MDEIQVLKKALSQAESRVAALKSAISVLGGGKGQPGRKTYKMSAATRKKIAAAATKRWAEKKKKEAKS